jgi:hypothetical protein
MYGCADVHMCGCENNVRMCGCADVRMGRWADVQMWALDFSFFLSFRVSLAEAGRPRNQAASSPHRHSERAPTKEG